MRIVLFLVLLFYSAIIKSVLCTSITVWFSSATKSDLRRLRRVVRTAEQIGTVLIQSEHKGFTLDPHISTRPLWTVTVWSTVQSSEHQNDQTQDRFLPSSNPSHEHLTLNMEHTTLLLYIINHHTFLFTFQICTYHTCTYTQLSILYIVFLLFCTLSILYNYSFIICVLSSCCHSDALWSFWHYNKFLVCVNIPGNKAHQ